MATANDGHKRCVEFCKIGGDTYFQAYDQVDEKAFCQELCSAGFMILAVEGKDKYCVSNCSDATNTPWPALPTKYEFLSAVANKTCLATCSGHTVYYTVQDKMQKVCLDKCTNGKKMYFDTVATKFTCMDLNGTDC